MERSLEIGKKTGHTFCHFKIVAGSGFTGQFKAMSAKVRKYTLWALGKYAFTKRYVKLKVLWLI